MVSAMGKRRKDINMSEKNCTRTGCTDSFQAFLVEDANFSSYEEYPIIEKNMIAMDIPVEIMPFNKALNYRGNLSNTFICTYSPDETVDRVNHVSYVRRDGTTVKYSIKTNEFVIVDKNGIVRTYYYPKDGIKEFYKDRRRHK
jgi:hypothetical protein